MKNQLIKDKNKRILSQNVEKQRLIIKSIYKNTNVSKLVRWNSGLKLTSISKVFNPTSLNNRCIITGRKKQINNLFRFSRLSFQRLARNGFISGIRKSVW